jgi:protein-disulfide isomerase
MNLDPVRFNQCLDGGEEIAPVKKDAQEGKRLGLEGTPSFFVNGHFMSGAIGYSKLREAVLHELSGSANAAQRQSAAAVPLKTDDAVKK